jgi:uncharacterized membrane protein YdjX (TVP38/TMEM64 family)
MSPGTRRTAAEILKIGRMLANFAERARESKTRTVRPMRSLLRSLLLICLILLIPILPFVACGPQLEVAYERGFARWTSPGHTALLIVALLATDVVLPIPSSLVSTYGGSRLGWWGGTCASWLGLTLGACLAFALARRFGPPLAHRLTGAGQLEQVRKLSINYGTALLVLTRALPILAEATVLFLGVQRLGWRRFLPPVLLSNLGIALAYSAFGDLAERHEWLPVALAVSLGLPIAVAALARRWWHVT